MPEETAAPAAVTEETAPAQAAEKAPETPKEPAETAAETTEDSAKDIGGDKLPDNVFQCRQKALDAAKEVRRWGEEITLRGMTSEERKAVKDALHDDPLIDVAEGEVTGPDKRRIIIRERSIDKALND